MIIEARDDVVKLEGCLDRNLWPTIQAAANILLRQHQQGIIIDGSALDACSTAGAETFRAGMDYIEKYDARIVVCGLPEHIMQCVRTVPGVRSRLPIAASLEEARASLTLARGTIGREGNGKRALHDILVPLFGDFGHESAALLACRLAKAEGHKARIHLVFVLEVPRTLPLTAPLPEEEGAAGRVLLNAEAIVKREGLSAVTHVARGRDAGEEIVQRALALSANVIVLSTKRSDDPNNNIMARVAEVLLERAPCEVILHKVCNAVAV